MGNSNLLPKQLLRRLTHEPEVMRSWTCSECGGVTVSTPGSYFTRCRHEVVRKNHVTGALQKEDCGKYLSETRAGRTLIWRAR